MNKILVFCFCLSVFSSLSQSGPRTWQDHLGISSCNSVSRKGTTIYASYRNGLIKFDQQELSVEDLNRINGLSDIGIRLLRTNPYNNKLLVIYDNANIDVIDANETIRNYPNIKLKSLNGKKIVNEVTFYKEFAYLACGFGIIVFDTEKLEIKDTYIIGANATNLEVNQLVLNDSLIIAATPIGIYKANRSAALNNYKNWRHDTLTLPKGYFGGIISTSGSIIACYNPSSKDVSKNGQDSIYALINNVWVKYAPFANSGHTIRKMGPTFETLFSYVGPIGLFVIDVHTGQIQQHITTFNGQSAYGSHRDSYIGRDHTGKISYWLSDDLFGLNQTYFYYDNPKKVTRNGTEQSTVGSIDVFDGKVAVSPSYINSAGTGNYTRKGLNVLKDKQWSYFKCEDQNGIIIQDVSSVLFDRVDKTILWACSWYFGVMKYKNNELIAVYTPSNTSMDETGPREPRCSGLSMDKNGNLWFANSDQKNFLSVVKKDGSYQNFSFEAGGGFTRKTFVDKNNYVWVLHERDGGLIVFKHGNFDAPRLNMNYKWLNNAPGTGNLESNSVYSIAEDKDGKIWIGTAAGIRVIYNPTAIFSGGNYDAQPIKIVQDGNVELLLGKEAVTSIVVDGANNKWCGTALGGVYCFSPDGLTQLYHFTKENSPLYSNTVLDLGYDEKTGDVFIGTDVGLQSFRGVIVSGEKEYKNVYAYPNPVKPNYQGTVLIRGLVDNSVVKIADESGNMVWEAKSNGGQIEWPITTFANNRVSSGVYIVYASTTNAELKAVAKVLVVN
jgi:hypothetical protein